MSGPVLITGAAGFAGSHLLDLLTGDGIDVTAWHRPGGAPPREIAHATWQAVDLLDRAAVREALARTAPAAVYHCAGAAHVGRSWESVEPTFAVNVRGTHHLVEGLRDSGLDARVLIPSSAAVYAATLEPLTEDHALAPCSPYALSKLAQEMLGRDNPGGPQVLIARAFNHVGPRQDPSFSASDFARRITEIEAGRTAPEILVGNLDAQRDFTDVRDMVRAYRLINERGVPGRVYNVCSGVALSIRALLERLLARARVPIQVTVDPARYRPHDVPVVVGDPRRMRDELGWKAAIPIERTLDDLLDYWRTR